MTANPFKVDDNVTRKARRGGNGKIVAVTMTHACVEWYHRYSNLPPNKSWVKLSALKLR